MTWRQKAQKSAQEAEEGIPATIVDIEETTAVEIFGEDKTGGKKQSAPDREFLDIFVQTDDGDEFSEPMSLPISAKSWKNRDFKMGRFKRTYGALPVKGMEIEVELNDSGYMRIKMR